MSKAAVSSETSRHVGAALREANADSREADADTRDATADTREADADTREATADTRESDADIREATADTREADAEAQRLASLYARSLIEASLDPLIMISPSGTITDVNEATIKVTGVEREQLISSDFSDYFTEPDKARRGYQRVFAEGSVTDYPLTIRHDDGRLVDVVYNASLYKDPAGRVLGVFAAARDVTAQKLAEAEIIEQRAKELERLGDLERFQRLTVGRELKMIELKREIEELKLRIPVDADAEDRT
jgi:PAS domain S-box-containing protein